MSLPPIYLLHPAAVHFPIALLSLGLVVSWYETWWRDPEWTSEAASWLLWLGAASAWVAMALGLIAEDEAPHVPAAWKTLAEHKELGIWTVALFTVLSLWRLRSALVPKLSEANRLRHWFEYIPLGGRRTEVLFNLFWTAAVCVLLAAAYHGGEVVFTFGMGVSQ